MSATEFIFPLLEVGWFTSPEQTEPAHDPGLGPCPVCGWQITGSDVRTVNVMEPGQKRSIFYRLHRTCAKRCTPEMCQAMDLYALSLAPKGDA